MAWFKTGGGSGEKVAVGDVTISASETTKVTLGFKPKYLFVTSYITATDTDKFLLRGYDETINNSYQISCARLNSSNTTAQLDPLPSANDNRIKSIDNDGFTMCKFSTSNISSYGSRLHYVAVG